jgi:hypothetical protein
LSVVAVRASTSRQGCVQSFVLAKTPIFGTFVYVQSTGAMHHYKRRPPSAAVRISIVSASGKPSPSHSPLFFATSSVISHLTPPHPPLSSCAGSRASPEPRAPPQPEGPAPSSLLSSNADDHVGELRLSVVCPPRFDSALGTVSGRCVEVHECFPWTSSHGSSSHRPSLAVPRRAESAVWTSTWSVYGLRFRPRRAMWHPIARVVSCVQLGHQAATGEPS